MSQNGGLEFARTEQGSCLGPIWVFHAEYMPYILNAWTALTQTMLVFLSLMPRIRACKTTSLGGGSVSQNMDQALNFLNPKSGNSLTLNLEGLSKHGGYDYIGFRDYGLGYQVPAA